MQVSIAPVTPGSPQEIPDKLYFRIGDVAKLIGVKPYVLRYWETEFTGLSPKKSGTGHRLYRRKDVELLLEIKRLLYDKRFTIEGARKTLSGKAKPSAVKMVKQPGQQQPQGELFGSAVDVAAIRRELKEILELLS